MKTIKLQSNQVYYNLNDLTGFPIGTSLIVINNTNRIARIFDNSPTAPTDITDLDGFPVWPAQTVIIHGNDTNPAWIRGGDTGYFVVQQLTSTVMPLTAIEMPQDIVTSGVQGFRRLQVDQGHTGFYEGRDFRVIRKIRLPTSGNKVTYKILCSEDFILEQLVFNVSDGNYEAHIWDVSNVTETAPFNTTVPIFGKNNSTFDFRDYDGGRYQSQMSITTGGTISVTDTNLYRDYSEVGTSGSTAQRSTVSSATNNERYVPKNVAFYVEVTALTNAVRGTIQAAWEERPIGTK